MTVVFTHELRARGVGASSVRRMVRERELYRVRRGAFSTTAAADDLQHHQRLIASSIPLLGPHNVVSHASAAVLHALPVAVGQLDKMTVTRPGKGGGRVTPYVHQYRTALPDEHVESFPDGRRTTMARTVIDLGRCGELGAAVAAADAAMRKGVTREQLVVHLDSAVRREAWRRLARWSISPTRSANRPENRSGDRDAGRPRRYRGATHVGTSAALNGGFDKLNQRRFRWSSSTLTFGRSRLSRPTMPVSTS